MYNIIINIWRLNTAQHFLLSANARSLSLSKIARLNDNQAIMMFRRIRWFETNGAPICPSCGSSGKFYWIATRSQFKCKECHSRFSVTSGTIFLLRYARSYKQNTLISLILRQYLLLLLYFQTLLKEFLLLSLHLIDLKYS